MPDVRRLKPEDREQWQVLWKGYQDFYKTNLDAGTDELWQRLLSEPDNGPIGLVFEENGNLLGLVHYLFHGTTWSAKQRIYLNDLYTLPAARGKGVGRALIEAVYEEGRKRDCDQVYWMTQDFNETGRKLYDKVADVTPFIKYMKGMS
jgi:GNAT superfamily N-acetyltransferase